MSKQSLLLVDGDPRSLRVLEVSLKKAGFNVTTAVNGKDALDKVELAPPDLVISETQLDELDGFAFCQKLKSNPAWVDIPFVFLTAQTEIATKIRGLELGVDDYLTKPIYIKEIVARARILLQKRQRTRIEERRDGRTRFAGLLSDMPIVDLIQTVEISRKSGLIHFVGEGGKQAAIYFRDGKVIDAEAGPLQAEDAVYRLLTWNEGEFEVAFRTVRRRDTITMSPQALLMEGMRRLDEWGRLCEQLPPLDTRFEVDARELASRLGDIKDEHNAIIRLFDGRRSVLEVIDACDYGDLETLEVIARLYFEGVLVEAGPSRPTQSGEWVVPAQEGPPAPLGPPTGLVPEADEHADDDVERALAGLGAGDKPEPGERPATSRTISSEWTLEPEPTVDGESAPAELAAPVDPAHVPTVPSLPKLVAPPRPRSATTPPPGGAPGTPTLPRAAGPAERVAAPPAAVPSLPSLAPRRTTPPPPPGARPVTAPPAPVAAIELEADAPPEPVRHQQDLVGDEPRRRPSLIQKAIDESELIAAQDIDDAPRSRRVASDGARTKAVSGEMRLPDLEPPAEVTEPRGRRRSPAATPTVAVALEPESAGPGGPSPGPAPSAAAPGPLAASDASATPPVVASEARAAAPSSYGPVATVAPAAIEAAMATPSRSRVVSTVPPPPTSTAISQPVAVERRPPRRTEPAPDATLRLAPNRRGRRWPAVATGAVVIGALSYAAVKWGRSTARRAPVAQLPVDAAGPAVMPPPPPLDAPPPVDAAVLDTATHDAPPPVDARLPVDARPPRDGGSPAEDELRRKVDAARALLASDPEEALARINEILEDHRSAKIYLIRADALRRLDRIDGALAACDVALAIAPRNPAGWEMKGKILWGAGRKAEARPIYERFLQLQPSGATADTVRWLLSQP